MWVCVCSDISVPSWRPVSVYLGFSFFRLPTSPETFIISSSQIPSRVDIFLDSQFWALALEPHPCMQMPCPGVFLFHWVAAFICWGWNPPDLRLAGRWGRQCSLARAWFAHLPFGRSCAELAVFHILSWTLADPWLVLPVSDGKGLQWLSLTM